MKRVTGIFRITRYGNEEVRAYVRNPLPPQEKLECLDSFEQFLHSKTPGVPPLIKAAMAHVQFESIHPFLDENGRLGRQLITLMLCSQNLQHEPILYLSLFFKQNRDRYYELLKAVRVDGDWESWIGFYLEGTAPLGRAA